MLRINNLHVTVDNKEVVKGVSLVIRPGEIHALMGPNGSGKSSLALAIAGHPRYSVAQQSTINNQQSTPKIMLDGVHITNMTPDERARMGLFLAMQYPVGVEGITVEQLLRRAAQEADKGRSLSTQGPSLPNVRMDVLQFRKHLERLAEKVGVTKELLHRSINVGFSGGEKKRLEILQMLVLQPKYAILDETDSGLDVDALRTIAQTVRRATWLNARLPASAMPQRGEPARQGYKPGILVITHYSRILKYLKPDYVHIMKDGKIVESGGKEVAEKIEEEGYNG